METYRDGLRHLAEELVDKIHWASVNNKLKWLIFRYQREDVYLMLNVLMPLKRRLEGGERSNTLYNEIMHFRAEKAIASGKDHC